MTVSLKGFFVRIPCVVPQDLVRETSWLFAPEEALGFLQAAKQRIIRQVRGEAENTLRGILMQYRLVAGFPLTSQRALRRDQAVEKIKSVTESTVEKISRVFDQKILEIRSLIPPRVQGVEDPVITGWLTSQFLNAWRRLISDGANRRFLLQVGISMDQSLAYDDVGPFIERLADLFDTAEPAAAAAKGIIKEYVFSTVAQNLPLRVLRAIRYLPEDPEIADLLSRGGVRIPFPMTRQNVAQLLHDMDDRCETDDEAGRGIVSLIKPRLDSLLGIALRSSV